MTAVKAVFLCVAGALVCAVLRPQRPEMRLAAAIAVGLAVLSMSLEGIGEGVRVFGQLSGRAGLSEGTSQVMLRATGIAMLAEFGAQLCRDADEGALAGRVELAGRAALLGMTAPLMSDFVGRVASILP